MHEHSVPRGRSFGSRPFYARESDDSPALEWRSDNRLQPCNPCLPMFVERADDEEYVRGVSRLIVPAFFRRAMNRQRVLELQIAVHALRARSPSWFRRHPRCICGSSLKAVPAAMPLDVPLGDGQYARLITLALRCTCGRCLFAHHAEVVALTEDYIVTLGFPSTGSLPGPDAAETKRRLTEVQRVR